MRTLSLRKAPALARVLLVLLAAPVGSAIAQAPPSPGGTNPAPVTDPGDPSGSPDGAAPDQSPEAAAAEGTGDGDGKKKKKKKKDDFASESFDAEGAAAGEANAIEVRGRVFAAVEYERTTLVPDIVNLVPGRDSATGAIRARRTIDDLAFDVPSARAGVKARLTEEVSLVLEADFAGNVSMRDGYVQWKSKALLLRAGQFKMPLSAFTLESPWNLPLARRGLLHEQLADNLQLFGRRQGAMAQVKAGGKLDPALAFGAFRALNPAFFAPGGGNPVDEADLGEQTIVGRASITPGPVALALVGQRRTHRLGPVLNANDPYRTSWLGGAELTAELEGATGALRVWLEGQAGTHPFVGAFGVPGPMVVLSPQVRFATGRALVAWRFGGLAKGEGFLEPFATFGALDPDLDVGADLFWEVMGGMNLGRWKQIRLTAQLEYAKAGDRLNRRQRYFGLGPRRRHDLLTHRAVVLEAGAAF
jgi:hypothetical protein